MQILLAKNLYKILFLLPISLITGSRNIGDKMSKYNSLKYLKKTKSRTFHKCSNCGKEINLGDFYYKETIDDKFLHSLHANKYCEDCYKKYGNNLLNQKLQ
jgi:uncharacterized protein with PIN domain